MYFEHVLADIRLYHFLHNNIESLRHMTAFLLVYMHHFSLISNKTEKSDKNLTKKQKNEDKTQAKEKRITHEVELFAN